MSSLSFAYNFGFTSQQSSYSLVTSVQSDAVQVSVYPLFYDRIIVQWSIPPSLGNCIFNVYRTDTSYATDAVKLNEAPISNTNYLEIVDTQDFSKFRKSFFMVEAIMPQPDSRAIVSSPTTWMGARTNLMQLRAVEITRRETILLNKFIGVDTLVFRRRYFGARCPNCYNTKIEKVVKDHCTACYGTSFLGGYYPGILTKVHFDISPNTTQLSYQGKVETNSCSAWTIANPDVDSLDILVRVPDFKIYRIDSTNTTEIQTIQVRQIMNITELNKDSVEMNLLKQLTPSMYTAIKLTGVKGTSKVGIA
jgi:hypothetical protein